MDDNTYYFLVALSGSVEEPAELMSNMVMAGLEWAESNSGDIIHSVEFSPVDDPDSVEPTMNVLNINFNLDK